MEMPRFICHDVFQCGRLRPFQRNAIRGRGTLDDIFMGAMRPFEGYAVTLAALGEGLLQSTPCIDYVRSQPAWRVQCHGFQHVRYDAVPPERFREEMVRTCDLIEQWFGVRPTEYHPPWNRYTPATAELAAELGLAQQEVYRKPGHYKHEWHNCTQVDFHYWHPESLRMAVFVLHYFTVRPHYIVGAPRSGTTALMRFLSADGTVALKEQEALWRRGTDLREYYAEVLTRTGARGIVDKNVRNTFRVLELQRQFPEARFTHLIRDGRAAISSWRDWAVRTAKPDPSIEGAAAQWCRYVGYLLDHRDELAHYEEVRYEDLCAEHDYFESRNGKWRQRLTPAEVRAVLEIAGPLLRRLGYA